MKVKTRLDTRKLDTIRSQLVPRAQGILSDSSQDIAEQAQQNAPVDTGALRDSIEAEQSASLEWLVHDGVDYGIYQELGTSRMQAQPFVVPAVEGYRTKFSHVWGPLFRV